MKAPKTTADSAPTAAEPDRILSKQDAAKIRRALIANIIKKIQRGGTATTREQAMLKEAENEGTGPEWVRNYTELAEVLGSHRNSFAQWKRAYDDTPKIGANGWHSVEGWREWFKKHPEVRSSGDLSVEVQQLEAEEMRQRVRKVRHLNDVREGQFTKNEVIAEHITRIVSESKSLLRQKFENELPPYLARQEAAQVRVLCKRALDEVCVRLGELSKGWVI
jgi:hypothetical protein